MTDSRVLLDALMAGAPCVLPDNAQWIEKHKSLLFYDDQGRLHREPGEGPASQSNGGLKRGGNEHWVKHGKSHRLDGPAAQYDGGYAAGGSEVWWREDELFRDPHDGPTIRRPGVTDSGGGPEFWLGVNEVWIVDGIEYPDQESAIEAFDNLGL